MKTVLYEALQEEGLTCYDLGRHMRWNAAAGWANQIARGKVTVSRKTAEAIAEFLDLPVAALFAVPAGMGDRYAAITNTHTPTSTHTPQDEPVDSVWGD